ncbi:MAG TPA: hypothetical protein VE008_11560 [Burkholderiales bacterium]|nr:hypothetical protein [Burkholderiales bacterium]
MEFENLRIEIGGKDMSDFYPDLTRLEVELDEELAAMVRIHLMLPQLPDGTWGKLDDERLSLWKPVTVTAGFESSTEELMTGFITHLRPNFDSDPACCALEVWGLDHSVLMDREQKLKDWSGKKDSDIAHAILVDDHKFNAVIENTEIVHEEEVSTILQRETDMHFLRRLALRNGYECYVEGKTAFFRPPQIDASPQPLLAAHFGDETTLVCFKAEVNALAPAKVAMSQIDRVNKEVLDASVESSRETALGQADPQSLLGTGVAAGQVYVGAQATGATEMTALCQALFHRGQWLVTAHGTVAANLYGHVLKPRRPVTIKGVGETYSGVYYVTHVTHVFAPDGYAQNFSAKRNALKPSGAEKFSATGGGFLGAVL